FGRRFEHDKQGLVTAVTFLGLGDRPILHPLGFARITRRWDERGHLLEEGHLDMDGKPTRGASFQAVRTRWTYEDGNPTSQETIGLDGKRLPGGIRLTYDSRGNLRTREYLEPFPPNREGTAVRRVYDYDDENNCNRIRYFDAKGKPALGSSSESAGLALRHDSHGRLT